MTNESSIALMRRLDLLERSIESNQTTSETNEVHVSNNAFPQSPYHNMIALRSDIVTDPAKPGGQLYRYDNNKGWLAI